MIGVDTNVLVRYFAQDDVAQATVARRFLERSVTVESPARVSLVVLAELIWVLQTRYQATRAEIGAVIDELLTDERMLLQDEDAVAIAGFEYEGSSADFADLLISALNLEHGCTSTVTFDKKAAKLAGMTLLQ